MDLSSDQSRKKIGSCSGCCCRQGKTSRLPRRRAWSPAKSRAKKSSAASGDKSSKGERTFLTPSLRRKALIGLCVAVWLLLLGSISYCLFLPDLDALNRTRMRIFPR